MRETKNNKNNSKNSMNIMGIVRGEQQLQDKMINQTNYMNDDKTSHINN
jgi:hypothetical protein